MEEKDYRMSFFKPTTAFSRTNRNLVLTLIIIWATAIFGFHILLRVIEKPTPEPSLKVFEKVWDNVQSGNATVEEKIEFADSVLSVLGKSTIISDKKNRPVLTNAISSVIYDLTHENDKALLVSDIAEFMKIKAELTSLKDEKYLNMKKDIIAKLAPVINLKEYSLKAQLLPFVLNAEQMKEFTKENKDKISDVMNIYLIHNRSFLTDTNFLGFPFHYFYTAIFLLVLFVALCWVYAYKIDKIHSKMEADGEESVE